MARVRASRSPGRLAADLARRQRSLTSRAHDGEPSSPASRSRRSRSASWYHDSTRSFAKNDMSSECITRTYGSRSCRTSGRVTYVGRRASPSWRSRCTIFSTASARFLTPSLVRMAET
jgi:hypothetical protein